MLICHDLSPELIALESISEDKIKEHHLIDEKKIYLARKYMKERHLKELTKMLAMVPSERIDLKTTLAILRGAHSELKESFNR